MPKAKRGAKKAVEKISDVENREKTPEVDEFERSVSISPIVDGAKPSKSNKGETSGEVLKEVNGNIIDSIESDPDYMIVESEDLADAISDDPAVAKVVVEEPKKQQAEAKSGKVAKKSSVNGKNVMFEKRSGDHAQKKRSKSVRSGLEFPVSRCRNQMKQMIAKKLRIQQGAGIYMAAVLEYLCTEMLELSGDITKLYKKKRINPRHMKLAIEGDEELKEVLRHVTIAQGGVLPSIHSVLLAKKSKAGIEAADTASK